MNFRIALCAVSLQIGSVYAMEPEQRQLNTALLKAARCNEQETVADLLAKRANPITIDEFGNTPLHYAAQNSVAIVELLLDAGADVEIMCPKRRVSALHMAMWASNKTIAVRLIEAGADISCRDKEGVTPLTQKPRDPTLIVQQKELLLACLAAVSLQEIHAKLIEEKVTRAYTHFGEHGVDPEQLISMMHKSMVRTLLRELNKNKVKLKKPASCTRTCTQCLKRAWQKLICCLGKNKEE